jgi:DMSO/TMAO reductase YedYZ molybdopterin-dependent catalytic subunit
VKNSGLITRRRAIVAGLAAVGGATLARRWNELPPTYGHLLRMGDNLTYAVHRTFFPQDALVREYTLADLTPFPATGNINPGKSGPVPELVEAYARIQRNAFADWRLSVEGLVATPREFSLADLKQLPSRTQITRHTCEEGWAAIGQWTGVPLQHVLDAVGMQPSARYAVFYSYDDWVASLDMYDALHPQTILAYGMNGRDLPLPHGAPVRLRVERQIGYKSMKYLKRIVVTDTFDDGAEKGDIRNGWAWYTGI